ncbi:MAG: PAS domain S-box protein [Polyangiaceae bacterium]|nr:PAS domain S-box protein [Polyangiaceae bacterium]
MLRFSNHERFLRALFDDAPYGVFVTRPDGRIAACNRHVADMLGYAKEELVDHHFNDFTYPEDRSVGIDALRALLAGQLTHVMLEKRYVRRNGDVLSIHITIGVIRDDNGALEYFITTFDDVTKERQQTQALLESEQRIKGLLEAIPYALFCVNLEGLCVYHKPARDRVHDASRGCVGKRLDEMLPADVTETILDTVAAVLSKNEAFAVDYQISDGESIRYYEAHVAPYGANEAIVLSLDVTDRMEAERDRAEAQAAIIEGQREVLRQISTPLMPIAEGVIAMPLVGPVDRERAQQMLSILMDGVTSHAARTVIIDIAGVPKVDTEVAELLARVTQVVKLLGAEALFAGVRPDVARNIIALGIDLTTFRSAGSFQSAIAMALRSGR